jgi:hypothetical protein
MTSIRPRLSFLLLIVPLLAAQAVGAPAPKKSRPPAKAHTPLPPPNCALAAPPPDAGVDSGMGQLLKIYPRNPDIGPAYAGCQTLWAQSGDGWETITVAHYVAGHVAWIESPQEDDDPMAACRVEDGQVVRGDPALCAQLDELRFESLPAACLDDPVPAGLACERR